MGIINVSDVVGSPHGVSPRGRGVLHIMAYTGRFRQKGYLFESSGIYVKGWGFHKLKHMKGFGKSVIADCERT